MSTDSIVRHDFRDVRLGAARFLMGVMAFLIALPSTALAQTPAQNPPACGPEVREEITKALETVELASDADKLALENELYAKYQYCAQEAQTVPSNFYIAARECGANVSNLGSLFYEEMSCAGYDPQRRQFATPIKIKQTFGFGGTPLPGSREYVLHCVADAFGTFHPVGRDSVHLANALPGNVPTWQFAVIVNATENLHTLYPMNNQTRRARSILSWGFKPTNCSYLPIWGDALNYRIRLDQ
jgi:hypothetical protein